jgi:hypothetical protein
LREGTKESLEHFEFIGRALKGAGGFFGTFGLRFFAIYYKQKTQAKSGLKKRLLIFFAFGDSMSLGFFLFYVGRCRGAKLCFAPAHRTAKQKKHRDKKGAETLISTKQAPILSASLNKISILSGVSRIKALFIFWYGLLDKITNFV